MIKAGSSTRGRRKGRFDADPLVAGQLGLTLVLLVGGGLLASSFLRLSATDLGFDSSNLIVASMNPGRVSRFNTTYYDCSERARAEDPRAGCRQKEEVLEQLFSAAVERVRALPGVESASAIDWAPLTPSGGAVLGTEVFSETAGEACVGQGFTSPWRPVQSGYFETMRIDLVAGRDFVSSDPYWDDVIVSRYLADRLWPGEDPIGKRVGIWGSCEWTVVGVAGDVRTYVLEDRVQYGERLDRTIYLHGVAVATTVLARTTGSPGALVEPIRKVLAEVGAPPPSIEVMKERTAASYALPRFYAQIVGLFAGLALLLSGVGLYGTVSVIVARSTREIGVRVALGATAARIREMVVRRATRSVLLGVGLGVAGCLLTVPVLQRFLYGMALLDPTTFVVISILLAGVVGAASYAPARRATRVDPVVALRAD